MIYCQCEHIDHTIDDRRKPAHWENVPATSRARLIYGMFYLCEACDTNHYDDGDRTAPSEPLEVEVTKDELEVIHARLKGMPINVRLVPAQIAALAAAADFILDNGGFPDSEELTEHLRGALRALDGDK
jgi:hypothetical protein